VCGLAVFDREHLAIYALIAASAFAVLGYQWLTQANRYVSAALAVVAVAALFVVAKKTLQVAQTFPELLRFRIMRTILA
jgi:predicted membrane channel-forming protein YqfA (hemolysin III family)